MTEMSQGWEELEEWERGEWWKKASGIRIRVRRKLTPQNIGKARTRTMRARELYFKLNRVLKLCGYERCRLPLPPPRFGANPVKPDLKIRAVKGRLVIMVEVWSTPVNDIMVFGAPPRHAGQGPGGNYAFLGLLSLSEDLESNIAEMYLKKLKEWRKIKSAAYQVPLPGSRICIRTWPQGNGWEAKGRMQISQGLVPWAVSEG